ncbi:amidohydrolase family protein [Microaerobacter geothermalis]|uniref:amidohydrolase family protein n=1 Tax=Microaerobacter geothermalis TaxID=674972 RepID=UPI001F271FCA|nr:amidohydrolase family protein [Microaerobacter geothermalis]MCF6094942.1 amidohydrolase family protein [Microaerobacter geothermalis]
MKKHVYDAHVHLFPNSLLKAIYYWFERAGWKIWYRDQWTPQLVSHMDSIGIKKALVLGYAHKPGMSLELNQWLHELQKSYHHLFPLGCIHQEDENIEEIVSKCLDEWNFAGMKIHALVQKTSCDDERLFPLYELVQKRERGVVIHAGTDPEETPHVGFDHFCRLMKNFPELKVQVAHLGLAETDQFLQLAEEYPHVYFDTAAIFMDKMHLPMERLRDIIMKYQDRILFGTDIPFIEEPALRQMTMLDQLHLPTEVYQKIYQDNMKKVWEIS